MDYYGILHLLLSGVTKSVIFHGPWGDSPFSLWVFRGQQPKNVAAQFDFRDNPLARAIYLRAGIICERVGSRLL
jgi:hypothetical protein